MKHILIYIPLIFLFFACQKDSKEKFYKLKSNQNFLLWKNSETINENDFQKKNWGTSNVLIQVMTGIDTKKNKLLYFVYMDKEKSKLNINQPKDSIENIVLYSNLKLDCYELTARKYVEKFEKNENMEVKTRNDSKYITNELVSNAELELDKLTDRIWYSKFDKDTIAKIKKELSKKLK